MGASPHTPILVSRSQVYSLHFLRKSFVGMS
jgi:hypothetical protein